MRLILSACLLFVAATEAAAQIHGIDYERLLIPIAISQPVPGLRGSLWTSTLFARNAASSDVAVYPFHRDCQGISLCPPGELLPPGRTLILNVTPVSDRPASLLFIDRRHLDDVRFTLRVQDLSRQSQTWGTEVPVVRERELLTAKFQLAGIPIDQRFRHALRVYDPDGKSDARIVIKLFGIDPKAYPGVVDQVLGETTFTLSPPRPEDAWHAPGFLQIGDLSQIASYAGYEFVGVEIVPVTPGLRLWAIVSITNDETQHVTTITPQ